MTLRHAQGHDEFIESMNKLSIIIINFNSGNFLKKCIESIKESSLSENKYEVIVVDNSSEDESLQSINKIQIRNLKIIRNTKNTGFAKANNQGIKKAGGDYILLLNPDTILEKDTLSIMVWYMDENRDSSIATCKILLPNGDIDDASHRGFPTPWNAFCHFSGLGKILPQSNLFNGYHLGYKDMDKIHEIGSCVGAFMLIRRTVGEDLGWLDEDYFWYGEDLDFCYRAEEKGYRVMYVPLTKITHYKGISSGIKNHSNELSTADEETKKMATKSRFDVMRIFYGKHYQKKYPAWVKEFIFVGIALKQKIDQFLHN